MAAESRLERPADPNVEASEALAEVNKRRTELWSVSLFVVVAITVAIAIYAAAGDLLPEALQPSRMDAWVILVLVSGLALAFLLYVFEKERNLRALTVRLVEERVLSSALSNRLSEISRLSELGKAINTTLDLNDVLNLILSSALELLGGTEGSIMLVDDGSGRLRVVSYHGPHYEKVMGAATPIGEGISGTVAQTRTPMLIQGDDVGPGLAGQGHPERHIHSSICVPLVRKDELLGVLNLNETEGSRVFSDHDLEALGFFAEHAAVAIGNASTYERERETVARLEELDRLRSDFVATISHELKTPLTAIIGAAKTVNRKGMTMQPEHHADFMEMIERQGNRLMRLVEDVLETARIEQGTRQLKRELIDLRELASAAVEELTHTKAGAGRTIVVETDPERPMVWGDLTAIQQIVVNLCENGLKYSSASAPVTISIREGPEEVSVAVIDRGPGIPPDELASIFDRFRQVDQSSTRAVGGIGLGLYIVKQLVDAHGGTIDVQSTVGKGTTFSVLFPKRSSDQGKMLSETVEEDPRTPEIADRSEDKYLSGS